MVWEYIRYGCRLYRENIMSFILAEALISIIVGVITMIGIRTLYGTIGISTIMMLPNLEGFLLRIGAILPYLTDLVISLIFFIMAGLIWIFLNIGIYGMAAECLRGKTKVRTMFRVSKSMGLKGILIFVLVGIPLILLLILVFGLGLLFSITGFVIGMILFVMMMTFFSLIFPGIVVDDLGVLKTINKSIVIVKNNYLKALGLLLFYGIISIILLLIPTYGSILGLLIISFIISPMMSISLVVFYRRNQYT